jgi:GNAT superfamily N-acetyltransferase
MTLGPRYARLARDAAAEPARALAATEMERGGSVPARLQRLWFATCGRIAYRRLVLLERRLDEPIVDVAALVPVEIGLLERAEIADHARLVPGTDPVDIRARLEAGQWCFVARLQGRLVCARWAATGRIRVDYLACDLDLAADEAYSYGLYTDPAFRGHGVSPAASVAMLRHLRAAGFRRVVAAILPENRASLRSVAKTGYRPYGLMGRVKLGPWTRHFHRRAVGESEALPGARDLPPGTGGRR